MSASKSFELVRRIDTTPGDILQLRGCWALRLDPDRILYLNGGDEGRADRASDKLCLRLVGYKGISVEFASLSDATNGQADSSNPLVHVQNGYALRVKMSDGDVLFNFLGQRLEEQPFIQAGPWIAQAHGEDKYSPLRLF